MSEHPDFRNSSKHLNCKSLAKLSYRILKEVLAMPVWGNGRCTRLSLHVCRWFFSWHVCRTFLTGVAFVAFFQRPLGRLNVVIVIKFITGFFSFLCQSKNVFNKPGARSATIKIWWHILYVFHFRHLSSQTIFPLSPRTRTM